MGKRDPKRVQAAEEKARQEYHNLLGKLVEVKSINGYDERDTTDDYSVTGTIVRIDTTHEDAVIRWMDDEHLDSIYDVTVMTRGDLDPEVRSCWIYGTTQRYSGAAQISDSCDVVRILGPIESLKIKIQYAILSRIGRTDFGQRLAAAILAFRKA